MASKTVARVHPLWLARVQACDSVTVIKRVYRHGGAGALHHHAVHATARALHALGQQREEAAGGQSPGRRKRVSEREGTDDGESTATNHPHVHTWDKCYENLNPKMLSLIGMSSTKLHQHAAPVRYEQVHAVVARSTLQTRTDIHVRGQVRRVHLQGVAFGIGKNPVACTPQGAKGLQECVCTQPLPIRTRTLYLDPMAPSIAQPT